MCPWKRVNSSAHGVSIQATKTFINEQRRHAYFLSFQSVKQPGKELRVHKHAAGLIQLLA